MTKAKKESKAEKVVSGKKLSVNEKYRLYEASVQNPEADIKFINKVYFDRFGKNPLSLREDFCGTGKLACEWVTQSPKHESHGIDLDLEPITYGVDHHYFSLTEDQQERVKYIKGNVMDPHHFETDVVVAFNFSYYFFKERNDLLHYFKTVRKSFKANKKGAFFIDLFGGTEARKPSVESAKHQHHTYFWECESYNPLTAECFYSIHFKDHKTGIKYRRVFSYDWRMWDNRELMDLLKEAGFSEVKSFWEGVSRDGSGNGNFKESSKAENCESWVTYLCAIP